MVYYLGNSYSSFSMYSSSAFSTYPILIFQCCSWYFSSNLHFKRFQECFGENGIEP